MDPTNLRLYQFFVGVLTVLFELLRSLNSHGADLCEINIKLLFFFMLYFVFCCFFCRFLRVIVSFDSTYEL